VARAAVQGLDAVLKRAHVYRVDYLTGKRFHVGMIEERRRSERQSNELGLLKLARQRFASSPDEAFRTIVRFE
jgi:hypothetical protein